MMICKSDADNLARLSLKVSFLELVHLCFAFFTFLLKIHNIN